MSSARYAEVARIFREAMELAGAERAAFLSAACGDDAELRGEVEALLVHDESPHGLLGGGDLMAAALGDAASELRVHGAGQESLPKQIGRYRILELIGEGGMGSVFLAEQDTPRRTVALKVIRAAFVLPSARRRFERETNVLARLQHPGIAQIYDAGAATTERGTCPFIAMEFVRGQPLLEFAKERGLGDGDRVRLVIEIAHAVQHAHDQGVIHRDLKPSNVLVTADGRPKLLDFGIAHVEDEVGMMATRETRPGQIIGTLPYMSPEQFGERPTADARSDIYALGVLLFELLTGELPRAIHGRSLADAVRLIAETEPRRLGSVRHALRGDLETIVSVCLERDPKRRYATALELARDLERHLEDQPIVARPATAWYQLRKYARRNRVFVTFAGLALLTLVVAATASILWALEAEQARGVADEAGAETSRQAEIARTRAYVANIAAAAAALEVSDLAGANRRLAEIEPTARSSWEYRHLTARTNESIWMWTDPTAPVLACAPTGRGDEVVAILWNLRAILFDGDTVRTLSEHGTNATRATAFAIARSRGWMFLGCFDGSMHAVRISDGRTIELGKQIGAMVLYVRLSADERVLAVCDRERQIRLFRIAWPIGPTPTTDDEPILLPIRELTGRAVSLSPDGRWLAFDYGGVQSVVAVSDGAVRCRMEPNDGVAWGTDFSPDGRSLLVGHDDRTARLWELPNGEGDGGEPTLRWMQRYQSSVLRVAFAPDGRAFATALANGLIGTYAIDGRPKLMLRGHTDSIDDLTWSLDATTLISCGQDRTLRRWDPDVRPLDRSLPKQPRGIAHLELTPDGNTLLVGTRDRTLRVFDANARQEIAAMTADPEMSGIFTLAPDVRFAYVVQAGGILGRWDLAERRKVTEAKLNAERIDAIASHRPSGMLCVGLTTGVLLELDPVTLATVREVGRHTSMIRAMAFTPDGANLFAIDSSGYAILWSLDGRHEPFRLGKAAASGTSVAMSPDGLRAYAGSADGTVRAWDLTGGGTPRFTIRVTAPVLAIGVTGDGSRLMVGISGGHVGVLNAMTGELMLTMTPHDRSIDSLDFAREGRRMVTASAAGQILISDEPPPAPGQ